MPRTIRAPARHATDLQELADRGRLSHAPEQPGPRGGLRPRQPDRLRRPRQGGSQLGVFRRHPALPRKSGTRRNAAGAERQARRRLPHPRGRAARADRQQQHRPPLGHPGELRPLGAAGPDHVRPDDRRLLDLHRHPGHPPGHLRDLRQPGAPAGLALAQGQVRPHRRPGRDGRRAAAGRHHERRRGPGRRSGPMAHRAPAPASLPGCGYRQPGGGDDLGGRGQGQGRGKVHRFAGQCSGYLAGAGDAAASCRTWSPTKPAPTTR